MKEYRIYDVTSNTNHDYINEFGEGCCFDVAKVFDNVLDAEKLLKELDPENDWGIILENDKKDIS